MSSGSGRQGGAGRGGRRSRVTGSPVSGPAAELPPPLAATPERLQMMMDRLEARPMTRAQVASIWLKAVHRANDAELAGQSPDGALLAAYEAGHSAALALLAVAGLRTGGGRGGHHEMAFQAAVVLGGAPLDDLVPGSEEVRGLRSGSLYDYMLATSDDVRIALTWMRETLPLLRAAIVRHDAAIDSLLEPYTPPA